MKEVKAIRTLWPLLKIYPWAIPAIVTIGLLSSFMEGLGIGLFLPFLQSLERLNSQAVSENFLLKVFNQLFIHVPPNTLPLIIPLCIFGSILLKNCFSYSNEILSIWLYWHVGHQLVCNVFKQLLSVSYGFLDSNQSGKLLNTLQKQTWESCDALLVLIRLIINACTVFVFAILLLLISWQLTLLVAIVLVLISLAVQRITYQVEKLGKQAVQAYDIVANLMMEGFAGMRVIRAFDNESYEQERFEQASKRARSLDFNRHKLYATIGPLSEVLSAALLLCILVIALLQNRSALPTLLTFIFMLYRLQPQVKQLDSNRINLIGFMGSVEDVISLLNRSDKLYICSGRIPFKGLKQAISFASVSFRYNSTEKPALEDISIYIPQGKTTAIVGPSGAGKSTFINLLCRFYDVTEGEIYVDDCPLRQLNLASWRSRLAIVSQDVHIFSTTVKENIAYGRLDATTDEIIAAARQANAHEFICNLPQGYNTQVGDRGIRLSGGQRQRLALARAIVRNPETLILDEATNALDSESERQIQEALDAFSQNRTVIVIAHRLSTIEQADQIVVLKQGRVVEQGNLQDLLKLNGLFAKLYHLQYSSAKFEKN